MSGPDKLRQKILDGSSDAIIRFDELRRFLLQLGFEERVSSSHHIFRRSGILEKPNLQSDGSKAKSYQVRQVRHILLKYNL